MSKDNVVELARAKGVTADRQGGAKLPDLTPKQKKELLGGEIGTAFDMYLTPGCSLPFPAATYSRLASGVYVI
jgi:hypothetical protein